MSLQEYPLPIYKIPNCPSQQLKVVLDYIDIIKHWDFDTLSQLSTSDFTQHALPASMGLSPRTKKESIESLHALRDSLKGGPVEVCDHRLFLPCFSSETSLRRLSYTMSMRKRAKFGFTYVPSLIPLSSHKGYLSRIDTASRTCAGVHKIAGQPRVHSQLHVWNGQGREPHCQSHRVCRQQSVRWW